MVSKQSIATFQDRNQFSSQKEQYAFEGKEFFPMGGAL
jgi:hypothetical protein